MYDRIQTFNIPEILALNVSETDQTHSFQIIRNSKYGLDYSGVSVIMQNIMIISLVLIMLNSL